LLAWQGLHASVVMAMGLYVLARLWAGQLHARRRNTFDNTRLMWHFMTVQGVLVLLLLQVPYSL
jgi:cytochrome c oxidase subunit I+III